MPKKVAFIPTLFGVILIIIGILLPIPSDQLSSDILLYRTDNFSRIDEYVGGDAYNYIIGASLVGGRIAGTIAAKAVLSAVGAVCLCAGLVMYAWDFGADSSAAKKPANQAANGKPPAPMGPGKPATPAGKAKAAAPTGAAKPDQAGPVKSGASAAPTRQTPPSQTWKPAAPAPVKPSAQGSSAKPAPSSEPGQSAGLVKPPAAARPSAPDAPKPDLANTEKPGSGPAE